MASGARPDQEDSRFVCGGEAEDMTITLWNGPVRDHLTNQLLQARLLQDGDVYALYQFQTFSHNFVSMARRCHRSAQLSEVARLVAVAYSALEPGTTESPGRRWSCRGGSSCTAENGQLNAEVLLASVQFLGLASSVANALAVSPTAPAARDNAFIADTVQIAKEHLLRWSDDWTIRHLQSIATAGPEQTRDGSSSLFFSDKFLWQIAIYSELAGILDKQGRPLRGPSGIANDTEADRMRQHVGALLHLFRARISYRKADIARSRRSGAVMAEIDRGFWRHYADLRYAGYEGKQKPVVCTCGGEGCTNSALKVVVPADAIPSRQDIGWDFSHARRLVHALDALERNRKALQTVFSLRENQLPPKELAAAFANNLVGAIWNGDPAWPLFANYWSGANGWYRVAYDDGSGQCVEGTPPFGLSDSFPTGGYVAWAKYAPIIGLLGRRLYELMIIQEPDTGSFVAKYYPGLRSPPRTKEDALTGFMFLPSLVGTRG